jgi:hypothetical protein
MTTDKIWTHSGDSHFLEPADLWHQIMPKAQADRMPRTEMIADDEERVTVDGKSFTRKLPKLFISKGATGETIVEMSHRPPGSRDANLRLADLDGEGVWAEVMYQSIGLWCSLIEDPQLIRDAARAENEWLASEIQSIAPDRLVPAALMPMLQVDDAVAECLHAAEVGLHIISLPTGNPDGTKDYNHNSWFPHRHRRRRSVHGVRRAGRRHPQLRQHDLRRAIRGNEVGVFWCLRAASRPEGIDLRRRGELGAFHR